LSDPRPRSGRRDGRKVSVCPSGDSGTLDGFTFGFLRDGGRSPSHTGWGGLIRTRPEVTARNSAACGVVRRRYFRRTKGREGKGRERPTASAAPRPGAEAAARWPRPRLTAAR
jgi:hypothetical protein